jgi:putative PIN family toxin of toxin-antitoxin system
MPNVVFDASSLVGALLKAEGIPERALLLARANETICLSPAVESEIREVFSRPKFRKYLASGRGERVLDLLAAAEMVSPTETVTDCRDARELCRAVQSLWMSLGVYFGPFGNSADGASRIRPTAPTSFLLPLDDIVLRP